jgi:hypothetical protein
MNPLTMKEAMEGLQNGTLFEIIDMREALKQIKTGESVLSPFSPPDTEALIELYGSHNVQVFIEREKKRLKQERKELQKVLEETCTPLRAKRTAKMMMNLFG